MVEGKENGEESILENLPQSTFFGTEVADGFEGVGERRLTHDFFEELDLEVAFVAEREPTGATAKGIAPGPGRTLEIEPGELGGLDVAFRTGLCDG
jgi:hypothetical protein